MVYSNVYSQMSVAMILHVLCQMSLDVLLFATKLHVHLTCGLSFIFLTFMVDLNVVVSILSIFVLCGGLTATAGHI